MTERLNRHIYRLRWLRPGFKNPRSAVFASRRSAVRYEATLRAAWPDRPIEWLTLEGSLVHWQPYEADDGVEPMSEGQATGCGWPPPKAVMLQLEPGEKVGGGRDNGACKGWAKQGFLYWEDDSWYRSTLPGEGYGDWNGATWPQV